MGTLQRWIEITFILILVFLVLNNSFGFTQVISSLTSGYVAGVKSLQGRG